MEAVIFDCDGVLVDSEPVYAKAFSQTLETYGIKLSVDFLRAELRGKSMGACYEWLEKQCGFTVNEVFAARLFSKSDELLEAEIQPIAGVSDIVRQLNCEKAVASNGIRRSVLGNLSRCGLRDYFGEYIYTADCVAKPKPAPDIYLFAAVSLGVRPERCLVIEDSPLGVDAALAAGMTVCCVTHGELADEQIDCRAHQVGDMRGVCEWLGSYKLT